MMEEQHIQTADLVVGIVREYPFAQRVAFFLDVFARHRISDIGLPINACFQNIVHMYTLCIMDMIISSIITILVDIVCIN